MVRSIDVLWMTVPVTGSVEDDWSLTGTDELLLSSLESTEIEMSLSLSWTDEEDIGPSGEAVTDGSSFDRIKEGSSLEGSVLGLDVGG